MWNKRVTIKTNASREQIWNVWIDVNNWNKWDKMIKSSYLKGDFKVGTYGVLKPLKGPQSNFEIVSVTKLDEFTIQSFLPFAKMNFIHQITEKNGELFITHSIEISGLLFFLFARIVGEKLAKELPNAMNNLSQLAEKT